MNTVSFRNIQELRSSNGLLKGFNQVVVITDDIFGGIFKTIRKGDAVLDGGVYIQGDLRYDLKRIYDNINVDVVWFGDDLTSFFNYCASKDEYAYMSTGVFDLNGESIELPANLKIKSGAGYFTNGTLIGNNTYFEVNQHHKLFDPSIVFEGEWKGITVTPQNFGAITNKDNTVFENDCSAAIQAAIDSPFKVHFPAGYYYITSTTYISRAKSITLENGILTGEERGNAYTLDLYPDHTRIYTDQDIDMFIIQAENVNFKGGLIDYSKAATVNYKAAFRYDLNYRMWGGEIDTIVVGNKDTIGVHENGIIGILVDNTNKTENGFLTFVKWKGYMHYVRVASIVERKTNHDQNTWVNSLDIDINLNGFKQAFLLYGAGLNKITCLAQSRGTRSDLEKDLPSIEASNTIIDFTCWDVGSKRGTEAPWGVSEPLITDLGGCVFVGRSYRTSVQYNNTVPYTPYPIVNPPNSIITKNSWNNNFIISQFDNQLAAADKRFNVTIKAHSGAEFDFNTLTESGLPENENILISGKNNLFLTRGEIPMTVNFLEDANLENDFVEIVITGVIGSLKSLIISTAGDAYESGSKNTFNVIQIIEKNGSSYTSHEKVVSSLGLIKIDNLGVLDKLIIRLIGAKAHNKAIRVLDFCATRVTPIITPLITVDGSQRIYGPLDVDRLRVKSTTLENTPINGCIETDGTNLYFVVGGVRKQITLTDL